MISLFYKSRYAALRTALKTHGPCPSINHKNKKHLSKDETSAIPVNCAHIQGLAVTAAWGKETKPVKAKLSWAVTLRGKSLGPSRLALSFTCSPCVLTQQKPYRNQTMDTRIKSRQTLNHPSFYIYSRFISNSIKCGFLSKKEKHVCDGYLHLTHTPAVGAK